MWFRWWRWTLTQFRGSEFENWSGISRLPVKSCGSLRTFVQIDPYMREGDTLLVWKLSRLARSLAKIINTVKGLEDRQIGLKVLTQNIDTGTPEGRLFFHMNAAFDQFQREIIVENTKAGLKNARKHGRIGGRLPLMTDDKMRTAQAMLKDTENYPFISDIIKTLGIGRTTFYRHFTPERIDQLRTLL